VIKSEAGDSVPTYFQSCT